MDATEKFQMDVEYRIDQQVQRLGTPDNVVSQAKSIYKTFNTQEHAYSRPDEVYALASLYLAHKIIGVPTSIGELTKKTSVSKRHLIRAYGQMQNYLKDEHGFELKAFDSLAFIEKFGKKLDLPEKTIERAKQIDQETQEIMMNRADSTRASSALYLACLLDNHDITQADIEAVTGVTSVTIRNRYKEQSEYLGLAP